MDTTKEYILMCEKAQEIQQNRETAGLPSKSFFSCKGDWFAHLNNEQIILISNANLLQKPGTWLPRQDQLQEMIKGSLIEKIAKFNVTFYSPVHIFTNKLSEENLKEFKRQWQDMISNVRNNWIKIESSKDEKFDFITATVKFDSFEHMWLALVMKENYNKKWNFETKEWEICE